jgi:acetyl esterase/lipase
MCSKESVEPNRGNAIYKSSTSYGNFNSSTQFRITKVAAAVDLQAGTLQEDTLPWEDLWDTMSPLPAHAPIGTSLRHQLYPLPPMRDTDLSDVKPRMAPFLLRQTRKTKKMKQCKVPVGGSDEGRNAPVVLVFPGGGYGRLSEKEGCASCLLLNQLGLNAVLVHYRVQHKYPASLLDARSEIKQYGTDS